MGVSCINLALLRLDEDCGMVVITVGNAIDWYKMIYVYCYNGNEIVFREVLFHAHTYFYNREKNLIQWM